MDNSSFWPGFHAFAANIGEAFGPRQPTWTMERDISGYYARTQRVLRTGALKLDVAVLNQTLAGGTPTLDGTPLLSAGMSYGYVTPGSLRDQRVAGGRLAPAGPAFQGLVVGDEPVDVSTARRIRRMAADGLTVVVVGDGPQRARGYAATAAAAENQDAIVEQIFDEIVASPNGHRATGAADAAEVLQTEGVRPDADVENGGVKAVHRRTGDLDLYALVNRTGEDITTTVSLLGRAGNVPYALDPWSGKVAAEGVFVRSGDRTTARGHHRGRLHRAGRTRRTPVHRQHGPVPDTWSPLTPRMPGGATAGSPCAPMTPGSFTSRLSNGRTHPHHGDRRARRQGAGAAGTCDWTSGCRVAPVTRPTSPATRSTTSRTWRSGPGATIDGIKDAVGVGTYTTQVTASRRLATGRRGARPRGRGRRPTGSTSTGSGSPPPTSSGRSSTSAAG